MLTFWRGLFGFAAIWNLAVGGVMLAEADRVAQQMGMSGSVSSYIVGLAGLLIATFGVGYALVGWRPLANRSIVVIGALGKAGAALLASLHGLAGHIPHSIYLFAMSDLAFALAFVVFLALTRDVPKASP